MDGSATGIHTKPRHSGNISFVTEERSRPRGLFLLMSNPWKRTPTGLQLTPLIWYKTDTIEITHAAILSPYGCHSPQGMHLVWALSAANERSAFPPLYTSDTLTSIILGRRTIIIKSLIHLFAHEPTWTQCGPLREVPEGWSTVSTGYC